MKLSINEHQTTWPEMNAAPPLKPKGWLVGLGVGLITLAVLVGLVVIGLVAKRKHQYRLAATNEILVLPPPPR